MKEKAVQARQEEERLRKEIEGARAAAEAARTQEQAKLDALQVERTELEEALSKRDALMKELADAERKSSNQATVTALEGKLAKARFAASKAEQERKAALAHSMVREQTLSADLEEAKSTESTLRNQLKESQTALRSIELEVAQLAEQSVDASVLQDAKDRLNAAVSQTTSLQTKLTSSEGEIASLRSEISAVEVERESGAESHASQTRQGGSSGSGE